MGIDNQIGDVAVILDAHCECVDNWLPPLLTRIAVNRKTVAVPIVDGITWNTIQHNGYSNYGIESAGIWEWGFLYKEMKVFSSSMTQNNRVTSPNKSPTHAGGLLAIDKKWFFELGGYDPGLKIWGAEQYELSFKVWQCGGTLEWVPCSHVGHIYRGPRVSSGGNTHAHPHQTVINHLRVASVWMDEYKEYYYIREPQIRKLDIGNITDQLAVRDRLQCKSFKWFMENVAYDQPKKFPYPPKNKVWGEVKNIRHETCVDQIGAPFGKSIGVSGCHHQGGSQLFRLNIKGQLSSGEHCFLSDNNDKVVASFCLDNLGIWNPEGEWEYDEVTQSIKSKNRNKCISTDGQVLSLDVCDSNNKNQKWEFNEIYLH